MATGHLVSKGSAFGSRSHQQRGRPTEALVQVRVVGPSLLAALALKHAHGVIPSRIEHPPNEPWLCGALGAPESNYILGGKSLCAEIEKHHLRSEWRRERCGVSLSPMICQSDRAMMVVLYRPECGPCSPVG